MFQSHTVVLIIYVCLVVYVIRLTKETRRRVTRGRGRDGDIREGEIGQKGCEQTFLCLSLTWETWRFTAPPAVALINYISSGKLWRIFSQTGTFCEVFSTYTVHHLRYITGWISAAAMTGDIIFLGCRIAHLGCGVALQGHKNTNAPLILKIRYYFFVLGKLHNGPFLGIFRGGLDFFDPLEISLEMAHYVVCPQKK